MVREGESGDRERNREREGGGLGCGAGPLFPLDCEGLKVGQFPDGLGRGKDVCIWIVSRLRARPRPEDHYCIGMGAEEGTCVVRVLY